MEAILQQAWEQFAGELRSYLRRRVRDEHTAEDLLQDVFVRAARQLRSGDEPAQLSAWLFRVAHNAVVDHYRARQRERVVDAAAEGEPTAAEPAELGCLQQSFRQFVHALPPDYREAFLLTELEGIPQVELARRLGIPVSTAKSRVQRARKLLRKAFLDCCDFEFDRRGRAFDWRRRPGGGCSNC